MLNAFSIDVEDWFCPHYLVPYLKHRSWDDFEIRVDKNINNILNFLRRHKSTATFFILGWIAERLPEMVEKIASQGHEIGIHGYNHTQIFKQSPDEFKNDIDKTLSALKKINNFNISGYRAPVFSIIKETLWALDILKDFGIKYDSSIYPDNVHPEYGIDGVQQKIFLFNNGLIEVPMNTVKYFGINIPCSGGGYFRLLPYFVTKKCLKKINKDMPFVFYLHPWEFENYKPDLKIKFFVKLRYSQGRTNLFYSLEKLFDDFEFTSISNILIQEGYNIYEN